MKKILIVLSATVFVLVLGMLTVPYLFHRQIKERVELEIDKNIDATVTFNRVGLSLFRHFPDLTVSLHNLQVLGKERFNGDTLVSIDEIAIQINLKSLISGSTIDIQTIFLEAPEVDLIVLEDGKSNFDIVISDTTSSNDSSASRALTLDQVIINKGDIRFDNRASKVFVHVEGLDYTGKGDLEKDFFELTTNALIKELTLDYGKIRYLDEKEVTTHMVMDIDTKKQSFTFKENSMKVGHFKFGLLGMFSLLDNGYDMNLRFATQETSFKDIFSLVPGVYHKNIEQLQANGELSFQGFIKGKYLENNDTLPAFRLALRVKDGMCRIDSLPTPVNNIQLDLLVDHPQGCIDSLLVDINNFHLDLGKYPVHGNLMIKGFSQPWIDTDLITEFDLSELQKIYPVRGVHLKGKLNCELKAKGRYIVDKKKQPLQIPAFHLDLSVADGRFKYDSLPASVDDIQLHVVADNPDGKLENTTVDAQSIHFYMDKNPVHGYVKVKGYQRYRVDSDLQASLDLADIERLYPIQGTKVKGTFNLDVKANGTYDKKQNILPAIDAHVKLTDGYLLSDGYPEPIENIGLLAEAVNTTGKLKDTKLTIQRFAYTFEDEPFLVSGSIYDLDRYAYDLKIKGLVDLAKITKVYPLQDLSLTGIIDSDVETQGSISDLEAGRYRKIRSDGRIEIKNLTAQGKSIPQPITISDAVFTFTPMKVILEKFEARFGKSRVNVTGDLTNYMSFISHKHKKIITGDMKLYCDTLDLNEWLSDEVQNQADHTSPTSPPNAPSGNTISVWEVPQNLDFTFDSEIKVLKYEDMIITKMDGEIRIIDGVLSMHETGFNSLNALFNVSGDYDTRDLQHPLFDFAINIKELDINKAYREIALVRTLAPAAADAYGILSVDYNIKGELDQSMSPKTETLNGGGTVRIAEAKIDGMKLFEEISKATKKHELNDPHLKDLVITTEIKDNKLYVKPFSMNVSGFDMDIEGVNHIDGAINYLIHIELLPIQKLKVPCHITGTYDNPKIALGKGKSEE